MIQKREIALEALDIMGGGNMVGLLNIRLEHIGGGILKVTMSADPRTKQPFGLLRGGAPVVLAESTGSVVGYPCTEGEQKVVGLEINASHVRSVREGRVRGICKPLHLGSRRQAWQIEISDEKGRLCHSSRLVTAISRRCHQKSVTHIVFGYYLHSKRWYTVQVLPKSEDVMSTQLGPTQPAIELLRHDRSNLSSA